MTAFSFFSNLAQNLIEKLPTGPNKFDINLVQEFYKPLNLEENPFHFTIVSEKTISDFLKELKTNKATGIDNLSGKVRKSIVKTTDQFLYFQLLPKSFKKSSTIKLWTSSLKKIFYTNFNQVFENFTPQILASHIYKIR